ncbi:hypothetical protein EFM11_02210 [Lactobacillus helveticus]|nr:hypothetical protein [Lactobacillus helveticus]MCT0164372.1 hypothetical protein [Lactobacillus helveticus]
MNNQTEIPAVTDKQKSVKLELSEEQADMIQTLLSDYVLAYRSDRSVDYKPELVSKEKVGQYPWVATPPEPEITNPAYDWVNKKWYSKNAGDSLPDLANTVADLKAKNEQLYQDSQKLDQLIKLVAMTNAQVGALLGKSTGSTAISQPSQPTTASTAQPTVPATAIEGGKK